MVIEKNNINSTFKVKKQLKASPKSPLGWRFLIDNNQLGNVIFLSFWASTCFIFRFPVGYHE